MFKIPANLDMKTIEERIRTPMSDGDLERYFGTGPESEVIIYSDLANYNTIDELLPKELDYRIILVEFKPHQGHWVVVLKYNDTIEMFNSYGECVDKQKNGFVSRMMNIRLGQGQDYLTQLMKKSDAKYRLVYNKKKFQKVSPEINTCGRHCALRIICCEKMMMDLSEYTRFIDRNVKATGFDPDTLVSIWIN